MFNEQKVTQLAVNLLKRAPKNQIEHMKLIKLFYLIDRRAIETLGFPMSGDDYFSLPHGPVLSATLDLMKRTSWVESKGVWGGWISPVSDNKLSLVDSSRESQMDQFSEAEIDVVEEIWGLFNEETVWNIREWTHKNCPEWEDPQGSNLPITVESIVRNLSISEDEANQLIESIEEQRNLESALSRL